MNHTKLILLLLTISTLISCKWLFSDPEPEPKICHYLPQAFKDYTVFKEGTWWVYEDSATKELDTFKVTYYSNGLFQMEKKYLPNHFFENEFIYISTNDTVFSYFRIMPYISEKPEIYYVYYNGKGNIFFPIISYSEISLSLSEPEVSTKLLPEYLGYENVLENVANDTSTYDKRHLYSQSNQFDSTWIAPNIGPIKYKLKNGKVLYLKNYHINQ